MDELKPARIAVSVLIGLGLGVLFISGIWLLGPKPLPSGFHEPVKAPALTDNSYDLDNRGQAVEESKPITVRFVGDIMLDRNVQARTKVSGNAGYPFSKLDSGFLSAPDYTVANLEGVVGTKRRPPEKSIDFLFDPAWLPLLKAQGIDAFSQANNHSLDQGADGYTESVRRVKDAGFLVFGHQVHDDEISLATTTVRGLRLALLGFNTTDNPLDKDAASKAITLAKTQADQVIVFMHWGIEYQNKPDPASIDLAHWLIDQGVDIVIGGHPHWTRGLSMYNGKPIIWSLGNFVFDQEFSDEVQNGLSIELSFDGNKRTIELDPIGIDLSRPHALSGDARQKRLDYIASISDPDLAGQIKTGVVGF